MNDPAIMAELQTMKRCMDNIVRILNGDKPVLPTPYTGAAVLPDDGKPYTNDTIMPFGKYMGTPLGKIPDEYVLWMKEQPRMRNPRLAEWLHPGATLAAKQVDEQIKNANEKDDVPF